MVTVHVDEPEQSAELASGALDIGVVVLPVAVRARAIRSILRP
jgi:hypothetical protein